MERESHKVAYAKYQLSLKGSSKGFEKGEKLLWAGGLGGFREEASGGL